MEHVENHNKYNTIIAPMNNKISTIAAGLASIENTDIQLCYASVKLYNKAGYYLARVSYNIKYFSWL